MNWYQNLYVGENIADRSDKVKWNIMHNAGQLSIYVITLASNPNNLLDIIPAYELMQKNYPKKDMKVIGLAKGRDEAENLIVSIVSEVYSKTGGFNIREYLKRGYDPTGSTV